MTRNIRRKQLSEDLKKILTTSHQANTANFNELEKTIYERRKSTLDLYAEDSHTLPEISQKVGVSTSEIKRLVRRAMSSDEHGMPYGYLVCIPNYSLKKYKRVAKKGRGKAGRFSMFLEDNPDIGEQLRNLALGKKQISGSPIRGKKYLRIYQAFRKICEMNGCDLNNDYPFINADGGLEAVRNYCIQTKREDLIRGVIVDYGDDAGRLCRNSYFDENYPIPPRPYDLVQLDGHRIDALFVIIVINELGEEVELVCERIWIISLIDVCSRAILGYSISLTRNYSTVDLLDCIASCLSDNSISEPHKENINGLPGTEIEGCRNRLFNAIQLDNAYAHTSPWLHKKLIDTGIQEVITNRPKSPRSNKFIERFYGTFEELSFQKIPSTTGNNPKDIRRRKPEKSAKKLRITLQVIEKSVQIAVARYNNSPHSGLDGQTPLEYLNHSVEKERDLPRFLSRESIRDLPLFKRSFPATIRGNLSNGKLPYIQFKGATYTSESLRSNPEFIGKKVTFEVNLKDIRTGKLYFDDGRFIDNISVEDRWRRRPHDLKTRQAILKLIRDKAAGFRIDTPCPVESYFDYLASQMMSSKKNRNAVLKITRESPVNFFVSEQPKDRQISKSVMDEHRVNIIGLST